MGKKPACACRPPASRADLPSDSKYPPAEPGALGCEPLKAADGAADAAPDRVGHLKVAISATDSSAPDVCPPLPVS